MELARISHETLWLGVGEWDAISHFGGISCNGFFFPAVVWDRWVSLKLIRYGEMRKGNLARKNKNQVFLRS